MKKSTHLLALAIFAAMFAASCKKDACETCKVYLFNAEQYTYQIKMTGQETFWLKPSETKEIEIKSGESYTVKAIANTYYAHNDFSKSVKCDGECGDLVLTVQD